MSRKGRVSRLAGASRGLLLGREDAQGQFPGQGLVLIHSADVRGIGHDSRHILSRINPRRIQLFIVPRGTFSRTARAS